MKTISKDWTHPDAEIVTNHSFSMGNSVPVVKVNSIHALNQLVGYVKYLNQDEGNIYFRGQTHLYDNLLPSIYRTGASSASVSVRNDRIAEYVRVCSEIMPIVNNLSDSAKEPLLQHYGIHTRWLDLVDNLWVALWFGIHEYRTKISDRVYEFVVTRDIDQDFAYILLVFTDAKKEIPNSPGVFRGKETELVDLRVAVPSIFLRPHCQHALLIKPRKMTTINEVDLATNVNLIIKIEIKKVREWIGCGRLLTAENIYPPPVYDHGYSLLLEQAPNKKENFKNFGSITSISFAAPNCS